MSGLLGSYRHQIDEKSRINLPPPFRRNADEGPMVLVHAFPDALALYPQSSWGEVEIRLRDLLRQEPEARPYVLGITANAAEVTPDRQGRILLPQRLLDAVAIGSAAVLVGAIDRVEIWDPDRFGASVTAPVGEASRFYHPVFG